MRWVCVLVLTLLGCETGPVPATDGGAILAHPYPPAATLAPDFTPCPEGWTEIDESGTSVCEPADPSACAGTTMGLPGEGCVDIGSPCPSGDFNDSLPTDANIIYVLAGATGGDGTRTAPYATIAAGLSVSGSGDVVALGPGTYDELVRLPPDRHLVGACAERTIITFENPPDGVITSMGLDASVRDLSVRGSTWWGLAVRAGTSMDVSGVLVEDVGLSGVFVAEGGTLTASELAVRSVRASPTSGNFGRGMEVGGTATIERSVFEDLRDMGLFIEGQLTLRDSAVRRVESAGTSGAFGRGLAAELGSTVTLERVVIEDTRDLGIGVLRESSLDATDVLVRTVRPATAGGFGLGVQVQQGATATLTRVRVDDASVAGVNLIDEGSSLLATDLVVSRTQPVDGLTGRGMNIEGIVTATLERVLLTGNHEVGLFVSLGAVLNATDLTVQDTQGQVASGLFGRGLMAQHEATVTLSRAHLVRNREASLVASDLGTHIEAADLIVEDTASDEAVGATGHGVHAQAGATIRVERAVIARNRESGVSVGSFDSWIQLTDVHVDETLERECALDGRCPGLGAGVGIGAYDQGRIAARFFLVTRSALSGVQIARDGQMDLAEGEVADNPIGVNLQVTGYDVARLMNMMSFRDNGTNLDAELLPVPETPASF